MASGAATYSEDVYLKLWRGNSAGSNATAPAHVYAGLHTGAPGEDGLSNHYGTSGIDRSYQELYFGAPSGSPRSMSMTSSSPTWTSLLTGSATITHISIFDSSTLSSNLPTGNCIAWGALTSSVAVNVGDTFILSSCTFQLD